MSGTYLNNQLVQKEALSKVVSGGTVKFNFSDMNYANEQLTIALSSSSGIKGMINFSGFLSLVKTFSDNGLVEWRASISVNYNTAWNSPIWSGRVYVENGKTYNVAVNEL